MYCMCIVFFAIIMDVTQHDWNVSVKEFVCEVLHVLLRCCLSSTFVYSSIQQYVAEFSLYYII